MTDQSDAGPPDPDIARVLQVLGRYFEDHPLAEIGVFRRRRDAISIRIIDPDYRGLSWRQRDDRVWEILGEVPEEVTHRISVLLLMTPEEAEEAHFTSAEFRPEDSNGPVGFMKEGVVFREYADGHPIYVMVSRPLIAEASGSVEVSPRFNASYKFGFPPGIMTTDDGALSLDTGQLLREHDYAPRWFDTIEEAKAAALNEARRRRARLAAA